MPYYGPNPAGEKALLASALMIFGGLYLINKNSIEILPINERTTFCTSEVNYMEHRFVVSSDLVSNKLVCREDNPNYQKLANAMGVARARPLYRENSLTFEDVNFDGKLDRIVYSGESGTDLSKLANIEVGKELVEGLKL